MKICPVVIMQQTNLVKPNGPKFKAGDHIRSVFYPEVIRIVRFSGGNQYIISPPISGMPNTGEIDRELIDDNYELCGIPEETQVVASYCHHEWKHYIGITNWYDYCAICNERRKSND